MSETPISEMVDAVVVGAGLAGLVAAHTLVSAGRSVRVLEADEAVGGRTRTSELADGVLAEFGVSGSGRDDTSERAPAR